MFDHDAIYRAYPAVKSIDDSRGAFDADGNQITLDQALVDAAAIEVAAEQALSSLRRQRDQLLTETDYLALADSTLTDEMQAYRQALRDLPANTEDPANPVWPTKPS
jgi:uncharacterized protein involved in exopolysaccharide biosynthesis